MKTLQTWKACGYKLAFTEQVCVIRILSILYHKAYHIPVYINFWLARLYPSTESILCSFPKAIV